MKGQTGSRQQSILPRCSSYAAQIIETCMKVKMEGQYHYNFVRSVGHECDSEPHRPEGVQPGGITCYSFDLESLLAARLIWSERILGRWTSCPVIVQLEDALMVGLSDPFSVSILELFCRSRHLHVMSVK